MIQFLMHVLLLLITVAVGGVALLFVLFHARARYLAATVWQGAREKRLKERQAQQPDNPRSPAALSELYEWRARLSSGDAQIEQAAKALVWRERAYELITNRRRELGALHVLDTHRSGELRALQRLAMTACMAHADAKAATYATKLLTSLHDQAEPYKEASVHYANVVLGRLALRRGDVGEASRRLIKAGRTRGGPGLSTGGPNMMLAKELLQQGEREAVLKYLILCKDFWKTGWRELEKWEQQIGKGEIPDFGKNLYR